MYGKVFESIFEGSLYGHWQAIVTMQQLIVLATPDGVVDMTPEVIAGRTSIPLDIIKAGLAHLALPDPQSRTPGEDGRRIVLLDEHRAWGWRLVNHAKYRALRDLEQKREADRVRQADKRLKNKGVASGSLEVAEVAHTDTNADTEAGNNNVGRQAPDTPGQKRNGNHSIREHRAAAVGILQFLNEKARRNYQPVQVNIEFIVARLSEGATPDDCRAVIAKKCREWLSDPAMSQYLRPATLFNRTKFAQYQGELAPAGGPQ